jgi:23S rRNA (cytidine1920-2'-O)/16S rRNA (cytidine1409-2'-O)-methyltransferase
VRRGLAPSRQQAQQDIADGRVTVAGAPATKPARQVDVDEPIVVLGPPPRFVGRGGEKLDAALQRFDVRVEGRRAYDLGASTGGFTDCLLQRGARRVYAVDVGYGQLAWKLREDPRVVSLERTNVRHLRAEQLDEPIDVATIDASFISLRLVLPAVSRLLPPGRTIVALVKPQFEVGRGKVGKGGVVRDPALHAAVLAELEAFATAEGLNVRARHPSPVLGPAGNREFFLVLATREDASDQ